MDLLLIIGKTILFYVLLIFILRIMGKREVGELSIFDVVVFFLISELFSLAIDNETKLIHVLIPITIIVLLQLLTSYLALKSNKFRNIIDGKPVLLIIDGKINQKILKKQRYSIDDLLIQLHEQGFDSFINIKYGILETNGKLSIITNENSILNYPFPLIQDGVVNYEYLNDCKITIDELNAKLLDNKIKSYKEIFLALLIDNQIHFVLKEFDNEK